MQNIVKEASRKFGSIIEIKQKDGGGYKLIILRDEPVFSDRPYMTITAYENGDSADFFWGHYDLTRDEAQRNIA